MGEFVLDKKLLVFVKAQKKRGVNRDVLRQELLLHGWKIEDVDSVMKRVYNLNERLFFVSGVVVLLLLLSVLWVSRIPSSDFDVVDSVQSNLSSSSSSVSLEIVDADMCSYEDDLVKDECYFSKIEQGFECQGLSGEEEFVCLRVLEYYLLE